LATERLQRLANGKVLYRLKRTWSDGSKAVVMEPATLLERLCALVPRPRHHLVTYHGVLAPAAALRKQVVAQVPKPKPRLQPVCTENAIADAARRARRRYLWAELMQRVFAKDVLVCGDCGGPRRVLTFLIDPFVVRRILRHLGLPEDPPRIQPARPPPQQELEFSEGC
jgi:hypothetical protein